MFAFGSRFRGHFVSNTSANENIIM